MGVNSDNRWYENENGGLTGNEYDGLTANTEFGTFANGIDDTLGYRANWKTIKGTLSGSVLDQNNMTIYFDVEFGFILTNLFGQTPQALESPIVVDLINFNGMGTIEIPTSVHLNSLGEIEVLIENPI